MRNRRRLMGVIGAVAAASLTLAAAGCSSGNGGGGETEKLAEKVTVKVGNLPYLGTTPFQLGVKNGFFEEEGLRIEQTDGDNPAAIAAQVTSGQLDIGFATSAFMINAVAQGAPLRGISTVDGRINPDDPASALLVGASSDVKSPKDLAGKKVAVVGLGSILHITTLAVIDDDGGDSSTIQPVQLPFPQMQQALEAGDVDAIATTEPFFTSAVDNGARAIANPVEDVFPGGTGQMWLATKDYIDKNGDVIERFNRAMAKSLDYARENPEEVLAMVPDYLGFDKDLAQSIGLGMVWDPEVNKESIGKQAELLVKYGFLDKAPALDEMLATTR